MIDTHCHIDFEDYEPKETQNKVDFEVVIKKEKINDNKYFRSKITKNRNK